MTKDIDALIHEKGRWLYNSLQLSQIGNLHT
jgi:hypothetical protein